jgi:ankyrin repeat protein
LCLGIPFVLAGCHVDEAAATKRLYEACEARDLQGIRAALASGADINSPRKSPQFGFSPLEDSTGSPEVVEELLKKGAAPKKAGAQGYLPLGVAAVSGNAKSMELILKAGALLEGKDADGETALAQAVRNGRLDNAELLLTWGANVNTKDRHLQTPLFLALTTTRLNSVDRTEMVRKLLARGANPLARDIHSKSVLDYIDAKQARSLGMSQELLDLVHKAVAEAVPPTSP